MFEHRYGKFLTILLIVMVVIILGIIGFFVFEMVTKSQINGDAEDAVAGFEQNVIKNTVQNTVTNETTGGSGDIPIIGNSNTVTGGNTSEAEDENMYKGFVMLGTIKIPKTNVEYPILRDLTKQSIEVAVAMMPYGPGLNQAGNTTIVGHNYRNGTFFSNNNKLEIGDKIYITDTSGNKVEYKIYNKYETTPEDADYIKRETEGKREITLATCTDNVKSRIIIWATAD